MSAIIPTLNSERHLRDCLTALLAQDYPGDRFEIIIVDAGSQDATVAIARELGVTRVLDNPLLTGEAGKAVGIQAADGELLLSVDSDNVVVGRDWLRRMVAPFADPSVIGSEVKRWHYDRSGTFINRWHALSGVADPLTLYFGNYARDSLVTGRWTDAPYAVEPRDGWDRITLEPGAMPVLGANGFVVRRSAFDAAAPSEYHFDLDFVHELVERGQPTFARVDAEIEHRFCDDLAGYVRKTRRRADDFFAYSAQGRRTYPWALSRTRVVARFVASTVLTLPILLDALRGFRRRPDPAWAFHVVACWATLVVYATSVLRARVSPRVLDRAGWRQ